MGFLGIDWFGKAAVNEKNAKISKLEEENTKLLQQANNRLTEIVSLNVKTTQMNNELKEAESKIYNLRGENEKIKNAHAAVQLENEKYLTHIKQNEKAKDIHKVILSQLISAYDGKNKNASFARTLYSIKNLNAECISRLKAIPAKYDFLSPERPGVIYLSKEQHDNVWKIFYPRNGNHSAEQLKLMDERKVYSNDYSPYTITDVTHVMLKELIAINALIQELEKISLDRVRDMNAMNAANEVSEKVMKKYAKNMQYFEGWNNRHDKILETYDTNKLKVISPDLALNKEALEAFKTEVMTEIHVESLNRSIGNIFRQILFELEHIKTKYESCKEIKNLDIFSKEMFEMFRTFKQSLDNLIVTSQNEIKKYTALVAKLTNEEDVALSQTIKTLGIVLEDEISSAEKIVRSTVKHM